MTRHDRMGIAELLLPPPITGKFFFSSPLPSCTIFGLSIESSTVHSLMTQSPCTPHGAVQSVCWIAISIDWALVVCLCSLCVMMLLYDVTGV